MRPARCRAAQICRRYDDAGHAACAGAALAACACAHCLDRHVRGGGDGGRRGRHYRRRCAGRGRFRRVRARPAHHGARQGALCRRGGGGGRGRRPCSRPSARWRRSRWSTSRCRRCSIPTRRCGRARRCCTITRPTISPSTSRSASATWRRASPQSDLVVEESYSTQAIEHAYLEPEAGHCLRRSRRRRRGDLARARTSPITVICWRASSPSRSARCASS